MNSEEHNVYGDIPGFDASKGERIYKAFKKLKKKIEYLEQVRNSERVSRVESQSSREGEDWTLTDIQYQLLLIQLQYVRSCLRKKINEDSTAYGVQMRIEEKDSPTSDKDGVKKNELPNDHEKKYISQQTQVQNDSDGELNSFIDFSTRSKDKVLTSDPHLTRPKYLDENSVPVTQKTFQSSSKPHYHLKLDDVPFILGASSTASHSVVANVQNIIARMKQHNKALCGPKHQTGRSSENPLRTCSAASHSSEDYPEDTTKLLNVLSRDLCELALKQQKLAKSIPLIIDATQGMKESTNLTKNSEREDRKCFENHRLKSSVSNAEYESKLQAAVKSSSQIKEKKVVKCDIPQKQSVMSTRSQPSNLSNLSRRKMLRSLQTFKTHLSEEDISWD